MSAHPKRTHPILRAPIPQDGRELTVAERRTLRNSAVLVPSGSRVVRQAGDPSGTHGEIEAGGNSALHAAGARIGVFVCLDRKARIEFDKASKASAGKTP